MEVTDEMVDVGLKAYWAHRHAAGGKVIRSVLEAALAVKPPPIQIVWATPMEQPPHVPQT
jgi:hypothetical protein